MKRISLSAPAKLNLGLSITGVRADGYHELQSYFSALTLSDSLTVSVEHGFSGVELQCSGIPSPENKNNLVWIAAEAFLSAAEISESTAVTISLHKNIPSPGGLGGGSSDAAAVLLALQELTEIRIDLASLGEKLGSDVPFFLLHSETAFVTGRGEILEPVELPGFHCVLVHSGDNIPTPLAYKLWDDNRGGLTEACRIINYTARNFGAWHEGKPFPVRLDNQFLPLLRSRYRSIDRAAGELSSLTVNWGLSGSGPVLYALFRSKEEAEEAERYLVGKFPWVLQCQSR
jgi:4-diphosphocytidyl-2-C-methyl-D-erythritol kinase